MIATSAVATVSTELAGLADRLRASVVQVHAGDHGIGSGVVWSAGQPDASLDASGAVDFTIITNAHVVMAARGSALAVKPLAGDASEGQRPIPATLLAVDPRHDLAALCVRAAPGSGLRVAEAGDSAKLRVGELVVAVGNPFGREGAMTVGVVAARAPVDLEESAEHAEPIAPGEAEGGADGGEVRFGRPGPAGRGRRFETEVIQADIRLYPGNSGGPLADAAGRVVGINAMVVGGLGFAIPSRTVQAFLAQASAGFKRPYLGVELLTVPLAPAQAAQLGVAQRSAILITGIEHGSPAEVAGVMVGDVLLAVNGQAVAQAEQLPRALARSATGDGPLTLRLGRGGRPIEISLTPELRAAA